MPWRTDGKDKKFDRIVSIGTLEHIQKLDECFKTFRHMMKPNGRLLVDLITLNYDGISALSDSWTSTRIFPNGQCHSHKSILQNATTYFDTQYEHIFPGVHYQKTLHEWLRLFERNITSIRTLGASERFIRMWRLWLASSEAGFAAGLLQNSTFVFTPKRKRHSHGTK